MRLNKSVIMQPRVLGTAHRGRVQVRDEGVTVEGHASRKCRQPVCLEGSGVVQHDDNVLIGSGGAKAQLMIRWSCSGVLALDLGLRGAVSCLWRRASLAGVEGSGMRRHRRGWRASATAHLGSTPVARRGAVLCSYCSRPSTNQAFIAVLLCD